VESVTIATLAGVGFVAYLLGTVPSGFLIGRAFGVDVRQVGSGNIGASNVARSLGKRYGALVLLLDALKGAVPAIAVWVLELHIRVDPYVVTAVGLGAVLGHCFPVWLRFRGGKGVATTLGALLVFDPLVTGIGAVLWFALYIPFRLASLGSLVAVLSLPISMVVLSRPAPLLVLACAIAAIIVAKHHANIRRLLKGEELRV
jgi:glycerol-3-phosphate acyltransferase PlsY